MHPEILSLKKYLKQLSPAQLKVAKKSAVKNSRNSTETEREAAMLVLTAIDEEIDKR